MSQSKHQIEALLAEAGSHPRHRFGQNFMIDQNLVRLVAEAGMITPADLVVEVGPGTGTLTEELLDRAGRVVAVEIDRDLAALLKSRFAEHTNFTLIEGDALAGKHELNADLKAILFDVPSPSPGTPGEGWGEGLGQLTVEDPHPSPLPAYRERESNLPPARSSRSRKLVANLPYNIASPLIIELLIAGVDLLAFTVQKEVALRLKAGAGSDDYGPLSVMAQMLAKVELLRTLPPQAFWPAPTIDSALVRMTRDDRLGNRANEFGTFVHGLFSFRRKMLRKALVQAGYDGESLVARSGLDGHRRPEEFTPEQIFSLFQVRL